MIQLESWLGFSDGYFRFLGIKMYFARSDPADLVELMDDQIVVEAVKEKLKASSKDPASFTYIDQLQQIITNSGITSTFNGDVFELPVRRSLQRFNDYRLVDLSFLQGVKLPAWCHNLKLQIEEINT